MIENGNPTRSPPQPKGQEGVPVLSAVSKDVWALAEPNASKSWAVGGSIGYTKFRGNPRFLPSFLGVAPRKINIEPENDDLEDYVPLPGMYSQVPSKHLPGCISPIFLRDSKPSFFHVFF